MISENLAYIARYPLVFVICFAFLFYYLGVSFFAGIAIFIIAIVVNTFLSRMMARLQK